MPAETGIVIALLLCTFMTLFILWSTQSTRQSVPTGYDPANIDVDVAYDPEIQQAIADGQKVAAIKLYRDLTATSLSESKAAIEFLIAYPEVDLRLKPDDAKPKNNLRESPLDAGIRNLVRQGRKWEAVQAYRDFTGAELNDATAEIERLEWEEAQTRAANQRRSN
ncbi:MAG: hypothetical protein H7Y11_13945 [Armatimonadetes bacterium]|nr:hypothetical protein [Anaerolineae bacterium]